MKLEELCSELDLLNKEIVAFLAKKMCDHNAGCAGKKRAKASPFLMGIEKDFKARK